MDYTIHGILQARILEWVAVLLSRGLFNPGIEPRSPALQVDFFFFFFTVWATRGSSHSQRGQYKDRARHDEAPRDSGKSLPTLGLKGEEKERCFQHQRKGSCVKGADWREPGPSGEEGNHSEGEKRDQRSWSLPAAFLRWPARDWPQPKAAGWWSQTMLLGRV